MELSPAPSVIVSSITAAAPPPTTLDDMHPDLAAYCVDLKPGRKAISGTPCWTVCDTLP